ncbi:MAG TPA: transposase [Longimicrobiales bacterium]|nr:transposase [Longimicrobiales bacterium]
MNLPGVAFHVTARVQNGEPLFAGLEKHIEKRVLHVAALYRVRILAYAIMPNHLHIVLIQGDAPAGEYLQALLRRVAGLVQRVTSRTGHVFQGPYFASPALDPEYLRNVITYVHLNPVRAGICADASEFQWSSHRHYLACTEHEWEGRQHLAYASGLRLFARTTDCPVDNCVKPYVAFLNHRRSVDALMQPVVSPLLKPRVYPSPPCTGGDRHWLEEFARAAEAGEDILRSMPLRLPDLNTIARRVIAQPEADAILDDIRMGCRSKDMVDLRHAVIASCLQAGHRSGRIARFLHVDTSTVSRVAVALRTALCPI